MRHYLLLLSAIVFIALPFWYYRRLRLSGENAGDWREPTQRQMLEALGHDLRAAPWLTPRLFLRCLWAVWRSIYAWFWGAAWLVVLGGVTELPWSWQRGDPLEMAGGMLEVTLFLALLGFPALALSLWTPAPQPFAPHRLAWHWLWLLGYVWLVVQVLPLLMDVPNLHVFHRMLLWHWGPP